VIYFLLAVHVFLCLALIGLVLIQQGKGADMGAAFGGGSNTLFGASGAGNFITKLTTGVCIAFMVTSVLLVKGYENFGHVSLKSGSADPLAGSVMQGLAKPVKEESKSSTEQAGKLQVPPPPAAPAPEKLAQPEAPKPVDAPAPADQAKK